MSRKTAVTGFCALALTSVLLRAGGHDACAQVVGVPEWTAAFVGPVNSGKDEPAAMVVDAAGNVILTGSSDGRTRWTTVKFGPDGQQIWVVEYDGAAKDLAVDDAGNVYVTGCRLTSETGQDYVTVKMDPDGGERWAATYNGPIGGDDEPVAVAVDASGYVYVTGSSEGLFTQTDYATVKYAPDGSECWVARRNGPGNDLDAAASLAVDAGGNVYVTGSTKVGEILYHPRVGYVPIADYLTVAYDGDGNELWAAQYDGPEGLDDVPVGVVVDDSGSVCITGASADIMQVPGGIIRVYATVKYDATGNQVWAARYGESCEGADSAPSSLVVDSLGNVYVTGTAGFEYGSAVDYVTVKYDISGNELWAAWYDGPLGEDDRAQSLALDASGNILVTGYVDAPYHTNGPVDYATVKYDTDGNALWAVSYNGPDDLRDTARFVAVDGAGNVYVGGMSQEDYCAVEYGPDGAESWVARYNGPGRRDGSDKPVSMAVDGVGNVVVTGSSYTTLLYEDFATVQYAPDGSERWVARYNGPGNGYDYPSIVLVDDSGNVYVGGTSAGDGTSSDYCTIKYDPDGNELWVSQYDGPGHGVDHLESMALDADGHVVVTGYSQGDGTSYDYATIQYDAQDGTELWVARYNGPLNAYEHPEAVAVDGFGNVYVTGRVDGDVHGDGEQTDFCTVKYDPSGTELWVARYDGPGPGDEDSTDDSARGLVVDGAGHVYVTGESRGDGTYYDYATVKYDPDGNELWVARYNGGGVTTQGDWAHAVALDPAGNVLVTGLSDSSEEAGWNFATVKYDPDGSELWAARYEYSFDNSFYQGVRLAVDGDGFVYVAGSHTRPSETSDYATVKYGPDGSLLWSARYDGPLYRTDELRALALSGTGDVYVTGVVMRSESRDDYLTVKYVECADLDDDAHADQACGGDDCDDTNPQVHPGARELCTDAGGIDEDCDGLSNALDPDCRPWEAATLGSPAAGPAGSVQVSQALNVWCFVWLVPLAVLLVRKGARKRS